VGLLKKSIVVQLEEGVIEDMVTLGLRGVGHAFPTGDPFRRLEWQVCADADCGEVTFRKSFAIVHQGPKWHVYKDTRLFPDVPQQFSFPKGEVAQLIYHYEDPVLGDSKQEVLYVAD